MTFVQSKLNVFKILLFWSFWFRCIFANVNPIIIKDKYFYDSVTNKPFFIKGVDYQPGGSSAVNKLSDPLSDVNKCARDIYLFQKLGINTIRIYSVNPDLDHDKCMTLLAAAGIYLVLDVNSPLENQHLNRYEPWISYNKEYLEHVFKVVHKFSQYNNTLALFAGNEIVNDHLSGKNSPVYIKALIRDMKDYISYNSLRKVPVGYSAADDLHFRTSLAKYLECTYTSESEQVDFYGVNSYQWCGDQTFYSSGYNVLVNDYKDYGKPLFLSEYGCNEVLPRSFKEVPCLYSSQMTHTFAGGLVYEFAQESNNYGLVDYDKDGNAIILPDFETFKTQLSVVKDPQLPKKAKFGSRKSTSSRSVICEEIYANLDVSKGLPSSIASKLITSGSVVSQGKYVGLTPKDMVSTYKVFNVDGSQVQEPIRVRVVPRPTEIAVQPPSRTFIWSNVSSNSMISAKQSIYYLSLGVVALAIFILY